MGFKMQQTKNKYIKDLESNLIEFDIKPQKHTAQWLIRIGRYYSSPYLAKIGNFYRKLNNKQDRHYSKTKLKTLFG